MCPSGLTARFIHFCVAIRTGGVPVGEYRLVLDGSISHGGPYQLI